MIQFKDIVFKQHPANPQGICGEVTINGFEISIIAGRGFYGSGRGTGVTLNDLDRVKFFEVMWWPTEDAGEGELLMEPLSYQSISDINNILKGFQK
tara:strand:+ start:372 stop:659 length:288 start_codon:yes stop_codon:yes gene_type:complete